MKTTPFSLLILLIVSCFVPTIGIAEYEPSTQIALPGGALARLGISPDGNTRATCSAFSKVHLWDITTGTYKKILIGHIGNVMSVAFSPNGKLLASCSTDGTILLFGPVWKEQN